MKFIDLSGSKLTISTGKTGPVALVITPISSELSAAQPRD